MLALTGLAYAQDSSTNIQTNASNASTSKFFSKEKWSVSYLNYMNGPTLAESAGGSINHYLTLKHKFSNDWAVSSVLRPDSNFGNGSRSITMSDPYLRLDYPTIYQGDTGMKVTGDLRYYVPISDNSRASKIIGVLSPYIKTTMDIETVSLTYYLIPKFYLNTLNDSGQKVASHAHYVAVSYKLSQKVNLDFALYPSWTYASNKNVSFNDLPSYPGLTVNISENFSISPYLEIPILKAEGKTISLGGSLSYSIL